MEIIKKVKATGRDVGALGTFMGVVRGPVRG
jgi:molybdopterin synthase catalytic subunit